MGSDETTSRRSKFFSHLKADSFFFFSLSFVKVLISYLKIIKMKTFKFGHTTITLHENDILKTLTY